MNWQCTLPLGLAALALLSGCVASPPPPPPPPAPLPLVQPLLSAGDIRKAEQHAYWSGYAAGKRDQKQQDAAPAASAAPAPPPSPPPAAVPVPPPLPPPETYAPKGPALPVATPGD